jgi:hypothetical protein
LLCPQGGVARISRQLGSSSRWSLRFSNGRASSIRVTTTRTTLANTTLANTTNGRGTGLVRMEGATDPVSVHQHRRRHPALQTPHLLHHNNGWEISRDNTSNYWLSKPANTDPDQTPILLKQSRAMHDLKRERARDANSDGT